MGMYDTIKNCAFVRELHVYGQQVELGNESEKETQHKGLGKKLMFEVEKIAKKNKCNKIIVISGVGVRNYYKDLGYKLDGPYMSKSI